MIGDRQTTAFPAGNAPGGAAALGRGGDVESSLDENTARRATHAQNTDGHAIVHDVLRWP